MSLEKNTVSPGLKRAMIQTKRFNKGTSEIVALINMKSGSRKRPITTLRLACTFVNSQGDFVQSITEPARFRIAKDMN